MRLPSLRADSPPPKLCRKPPSPDPPAPSRPLPPPRILSSPSRSTPLRPRAAAAAHRCAAPRPLHPCQQGLPRHEVAGSPAVRRLTAARPSWRIQRRIVGGVTRASRAASRVVRRSLSGVSFMPELWRAGEVAIHSRTMRIPPVGMLTRTASANPRQHPPGRLAQLQGDVHGRLQVRGTCVQVGAAQRPLAQHGAGGVEAVRV